MRFWLATTFWFQGKYANIEYTWNVCCCPRTAFFLSYSWDVVADIGGGEMIVRLGCPHSCSTSGRRQKAITTSRFALSNLIGRLVQTITRTREAVHYPCTFLVIKLPARGFVGRSPVGPVQQPGALALSVGGPALHAVPARCSSS